MDDGNIAPSHRLIASPHRPSHRLIVHRIASSSIASPHRLPLRNASWTTGCSSCACLTHCGLGSWTHRPTVLSAPVSEDARPNGLTAPSKLDVQPHLGFAPLDLQPHPESATVSRHSSSQRNQIGPYHTNY